MAEDFVKPRELDTERADRIATDNVLFQKHDLAIAKIDVVELRVSKLETAFTRLTESAETISKCMRIGAAMGIVWLCKQVPVLAEYAHAGWKVMFP